jgi:hypothetical protein
MTDYAALARQTLDTSNRLKLLADAMEAASFHADGYPPPLLREVANTLCGTAMRAAMAADDTALLSELTGRRMVALHSEGPSGDPAINGHGKWCASLHAPAGLTYACDCNEEGAG